MATSIDELERWLDQPEDRHFEFKEAKTRFDKGKLMEYCAALANEGGGKLIFGVSNNRPRRIVGSRAFHEPGEIAADIFQKLDLQVVPEEISHSNGRVLVFHIPSHPPGLPVQYDGKYLMRAGDSLVGMSPDILRSFFAQSQSDFSGEVCVGLTIDDLELPAIDLFRRMWHQRSGAARILHASPLELLQTAELAFGNDITYAALILFGNQSALSRYLAQAEIVVEYRSSEATKPAAQRVEFRRGFFSILDDLWELINSRNELQHYQEGFFVFDIPTLNEVVVREAILNAVSHREYRLAGSVFVRQYPRRLEVVSPGGFPPGINVDNILERQLPRNRRIAETFSRCGLVERAGLGMNLMFETCIQESKRQPDFSGTDEYQVAITLYGEVQDPQFIRFLEQISKETLGSFSTADFLLLDLVHREERVPHHLRHRAHWLTEQGILERIGRGRGTRYVLSRKFYGFIGRRGAYTARRGLDRETNKQLLLKHIRDSRKTGCQLQELCQVVPGLSRNQVQVLLRELKAQGAIQMEGRTRGARWFPVAS